MSADVLSFVVWSITVTALVAVPFTAYRKGRSGAPPFPGPPLVIAVWLTILLLGLLYYSPTIHAGPEAGRASCAINSLAFGCLFWTVMPPLWPLLLPTVAYLIAYAVVRLAPPPLASGFDRFDRWLEDRMSEAQRQEARRRGSRR